MRFIAPQGFFFSKGLLKIFHRRAYRSRSLFLYFLFAITLLRTWLKTKNFVCVRYVFNAIKLIQFFRTVKIDQKTIVCCIVTSYYVNRIACAWCTEIFSFEIFFSVKRAVIILRNCCFSKFIISIFSLDGSCEGTRFMCCKVCITRFPPHSLYAPTYLSTVQRATNCVYAILLAVISRSKVCLFSPLSF